MSDLKHKIIMDVDTGSDDAVALILAMLDDSFDLQGITAVNGNLEVKLTTENSLRMVEFCNRQDTVKVYKGADLPLVSTLLPNTPQSMAPIPRREGESVPEGLHHASHIEVPKFTIKEEDDSAVVWLINKLRHEEDKSITIVAVGPLTNIALAMRSDPRIIPKIKRIVIMGGADAYAGSSSMAAEFNVWIDPEAMEIVLQSGCDVTIVPLDATFSSYITPSDAEDIRAIGTPEADKVADLILKYGTAKMLKGRDEEELHIPIHDALALCSVRYPEVLYTKEVCCHVDTSHGIAYGETVIDKRRGVTASKPNCKFAFKADRELFVSWIKDVLTKAKER